MTKGIDQGTAIALIKGLGGGSAASAAQAAQAAAEIAQSGAEAAQAAAEAALAEIPSDYSEMAADVSNLKSQIKATEIVVQSESKPIVQIADGSANNVKNYDVQITPNQDLHGYDHPWPAGGGKNLVDYLSCIGVGARNGTESIYSNNTSISGNVLTISLPYSSNGGILKGIQHPAIAEGTIFTLSMEVKCTGTNIAVGYGKYEGAGTNQIDANIPVTADTWTTITKRFTAQGGDVGLFVQPQVNGTTLDVRNLQIEIGSSATAYATYSNICPISGWTGAKVARTGKNLFNISALVSGGIRGEVGTSLSNANWRRTPYIFLPAGKYTVSRATLDWWKLFSYTTADDSTVIKQFFNDNTHLSYTITLDTDCYIRIGFDYIPTDSDKIQLELGESATAYEPYSGSDYSIDFPQSAGTVYGGSLHVNEDGSGTLVVDKAEFDMGTLNWGSNGVINRCQRYSAAVRVMENGFDNDAISSIFESNKAPVGGSSAGKDNTICRYSGSIYVNCNAYVDNLLGFKDFVNGQIVIVPLATPQTYTLTAPQIALLLGENNLWADTGDMAVEYIADTKLYIQTLTGHPDEDMIADSNIPSGQFFMVGNRLFISTSAIASGETIVPGTNCTETNLAAALNTINAD